MISNPAWNCNLVDLEALDDFLLSDRAPDNCMGLSDLDGFLTGIVLTPEFIPIWEWMQIVWGGDEPDFTSMTEAGVILGSITARYNEISARLDTEPEDIDPIFWIGPSGRVIIDDWAIGFVEAVRLRATAWEPLLRHREARSLIGPILLLGTEEVEQPPVGLHPLSDNEMDELLENGAEIIPDRLIKIRAFWREYVDRKPVKDEQRYR